MSTIERPTLGHTVSGGERKPLTIEDIDPCPFCAGKGLPLYFDNGELAKYVICQDCDADGPMDPSSSPTLDSVIRLWNGRANVY